MRGTVRGTVRGLIACVAVVATAVVASGCCCPCSYVGGVDVDAGLRQELKPDLRPQAKSAHLR